MIRRTLAAAIMLVLAACGAAAQEGCRIEPAPKQLEATRGGEAQVFAVSARPPAQTALTQATLELAAPAGVTATVLGPPPVLPTRGDIAWKVRVQISDAAPPKGDIVINVACELASSPTSAPETRFSLLAMPFTVRSATQAFGKLKLRAEVPAEPVNERRAGALAIVVENQGEQDLFDASLTAEAPGFLRIEPASVALGRIAAGTTRVLSFRVTQTDRADPGAAAPRFSLRAHAAGEATEGTVSIAAPVALSVLGLSDALKLVQVPSFLLLPGALFLLTCGLIWEIRNPGAEFRLAWSKPSFWVVAVTLSIFAAVFYPLVTGLFGTPREYLSAYTLFDVMLVWFSSIILAVPAYALTAWGRNRWAASAARAAEQERRQREIIDTDDALTVLRKLNAMAALPSGQVLPVVTVRQGSDEQRVLLTPAIAGDRQWVVPRASLAATDSSQQVDWNAVDDALAAAQATPGVRPLLELCAQPGATVRATWAAGTIVGGPTLWPTADRAPTGNRLPLIDR